jgi:hypothetical protein
MVCCGFVALVDLWVSFRANGPDATHVIGPDIIDYRNRGALGDPAGTRPGGAGLLATHVIGPGTVACRNPDALGTPARSGNLLAGQVIGPGTVDCRPDGPEGP